MDYLCFVGADGTRTISVIASTFFDGIGVFGDKIVLPGDQPPDGPGRGNFMIARHAPDGTVSISADR